MTPAAGDPDRKAAEWVLSIGGVVTIDDGNYREVHQIKDLPAGLQNLQRLDLTHNQLTDSGLKDLANLINLKHLDISGNKVTAAGGQGLHKALPQCQIVSDHGELKPVP